ncbi:MAG TPA: hypothetical protein VH877_01335 [Polyangia bacterium]|nr:hypothetical protein [Polyangia bacterium]
MLVTREGRFITCLGPGMRTGGWSVLPWERLLLHVERTDRDAARIERALETLNAQGARPLILKLTNFGPRLPREQFQELVAVEPLLHHTLLAELIETATAVGRATPGIARIKRPRAAASRRRHYGNSMHLLGHLLLLGSQ